MANAGSRGGPPGFRSRIPRGAPPRATGNGAAGPHPVDGWSRPLDQYTGTTGESDGQSLLSLAFTFHTYNAIEPEVQCLY